MLTPDEIRVKEFLPAMRGYDADEVRAFLSQIADTMEVLERTISEAAARAEEPAPGVQIDPQLGSRMTRLGEELELALWTMRRLEATVERLDGKLVESTSPVYLAS